MLYCLLPFASMAAIGIESQIFFPGGPTISALSAGERSSTLRSVSSVYFVGVCPDSFLSGRDPWTEEEDEQLLESLAKLGKRWNLISGFLNGRPSVHCRNRWLSLVRAGRAVDGDSSSSTVPSSFSVPRTSKILKKTKMDEPQDLEARLFSVRR